MTATQVWSDDLSGAAELAQAWSRRSRTPVEVRLAGAGTIPVAEAGQAVWDLDIRHLRGERLTRRLSTLMAGAGSARLALKLDSQLRGPVRDYAEALLGSGRPVVLCAAHPALGRVTEGGVQRVPGARPRSLGAVFAGLDHHHVGEDHARVSELSARGLPALITADVTSVTALADLATYCRSDPAIITAGSAEFLAEVLAGSEPAEAATEDPSPDPTQLFAVLGTHDAVTAGQLDALREGGETVVLTAGPTADVPTAVATLLAALERGGHAAVHLPAEAGEPGELEAAWDRLLAIAEATLDRAPARTTLLLSGGHTARRVLERAGIDHLSTTGAASQALAHLRTPAGRDVITKPGSYGARTLLRDLVLTTASASPLR